MDARAQLSRAETLAIPRYPSKLISAAAAVLKRDFEGGIAATFREHFLLRARLTMRLGAIVNKSLGVATEKSKHVGGCTAEPTSFLRFFRTSFSVLRTRRRPPLLVKTHTPIECQINL